MLAFAGTLLRRGYCTTSRPLCTNAFLPGCGSYATKDDYNVYL